MKVIIIKQLLDYSPVNETPQRRVHWPGKSGIFVVANGCTGTLNKLFFYM